MVDVASDENGDDVDKEAVSFSAKTIKNHFSLIMQQYYNLDPAKWAKCIITNNAQVNIKLCEHFNFAAGWMPQPFVGV
jgi:hypothetical protein